MPEPPTTPDSTGAPEDVFAAFLAQQAAGEGVEFEELVRKHPTLRAPLEKLHADWERVEGLLARLGVTQSLSERIESFHGQIDPGVSLAPDESNPTTSKASSARLERLALLSAPESRYSLRGEIGRGGMGAIQRVWDEDLRRPVAMKVVLGGREFLGASERAQIEPHKVVRFLEEAQITSQLEHPGVVPVHELGLDGHGRIYFTMRLVRGQNLRQIAEYVHHPELADEDGVRERWTIPGAVSVLLRVTEAVAFAHSKGVIHRDLKPANIMVGRFGETYVMDWGLARVKGRKDLKNLRLREDESESQSEVRTDRLDEESQSADAPLVTMDGDVVGTPAYMSPEQARGRIDEVDEQSDVYGVGAMLYHLVSGHRPYLEPGQRLPAHTVLNAVRLGPPKSIEELAPETPPELVAICERAMARKKSERYPTMEAFAGDLRAYLEMRVVQAYRTGAVAELKKWVARNKPLAAALAAVLFVTIAGLAAIGLQQARHVAELQPHVDGRELEIVRKMSDELWPAWPENAPELEYWLERARALEAKSDRYVAALASLRSRASELTELEREREDKSKAAWLRKRERDYWTLQRLRIEERRRAELAEEQRGEGLTVEDWIPHQAFLDITVELEQSVVDLDERLATRQHWTFATLEDRTDHVLMSDLVDGLGELPALIESLEDRHTLATVLHEESIGSDAKSLWREALHDVTTDPTFGGFVLEPIVGLRPLRKNPRSGLWEFVWLPSGRAPAIDDRTGRVRLDKESGIVLVLLPGGVTRIGCINPNREPDHALGEPYVDRFCDYDLGEGPVREVRLDPFFCSKFEVTQAQWTRVMGENPSFNFAGFIMDEPSEDSSWTHPVDQIDWWSGLEFARRTGLFLPTSTQWEYACRGGTGHVFAITDDPFDLETHANLAERSYANLWASTGVAFDPSLDDGHSNTAAAGSYRPNGFGLHDMLGNVLEWCIDWHSPEEITTIRDGDGLREHPTDKQQPVLRGGSYAHPPTKTRAASYTATDPEQANPTNGLRLILPARAPE